MEVHVDRDAFIRGLQIVHNIVEPRQTLPILANVLVEAEGDTLRLTATDLEVGVRVSVPAKVAKPGSITMSARKLMEIVKELPAAPLALRVQDNAWVALRCGGASYKLVGLDAGGVSRGGGRGSRRLDHPRRQGPARHAGPDELRDLARREPLCAERRPVRGAGQGDPDGGHRRASAGPGGAASCRARGRRCPGSCRARRSRRSRGSWARARRCRSRSATTSSCSGCRTCS